MEVDFLKHPLNETLDYFKYQDVIDPIFAYGPNNVKHLEEPVIQLLVFKRVILGAMIYFPKGHYSSNSQNNSADWQSDNRIDPIELAFLTGKLKENEGAVWCIENSLDGVHVHKRYEVMSGGTRFSLATYMEEKNSMWWKLKYDQD